jgi:hypothetical protein
MDPEQVMELLLKEITTNQEKAEADRKADRKADQEKAEADRVQMQLNRILLR